MSADTIPTLLMTLLVFLYSVGASQPNKPGLKKLNFGRELSFNRWINTQTGTGDLPISYETPSGKVLQDRLRSFYRRNNPQPLTIADDSPLVSESTAMTPYQSESAAMTPHLDRELSFNTWGNTHHHGSADVVSSSEGNYHQQESSSYQEEHHTIILIPLRSMKELEYSEEGVDMIYDNRLIARILNLDVHPFIHLEVNFAGLNTPIPSTMVYYSSAQWAMDAKYWVTCSPVYRGYYTILEESIDKAVEKIENRKQEFEKKRLKALRKHERKLQLENKKQQLGYLNLEERQTQPMTHEERLQLYDEDLHRRNEQLKLERQNRGPRVQKELQLAPSQLERRQHRLQQIQKKTQQFGQQAVQQHYYNYLDPNTFYSNPSANPHNSNIHSQTNNLIAPHNIYHPGNQNPQNNGYQQIDHYPANYGYDPNIQYRQQ